MKSIDTDPIDKYAVIGNPVAHSQSPFIHSEFARQTGEHLTYHAILVPVNGFSAALHSFIAEGGKGLNITVPFKEAAWQSVTNRTSRAESAGAVNTITVDKHGNIRGDNTDGVGLIRDLARNHIDISDKRVLILGAGGAVRGVLGPLLLQKPGSVLIVNRTLNRAEALAQHYSKDFRLSTCMYPDLKNKGSFDLVINGTSAGLIGGLPPLADGLVAGDGCCYDMVYGATDTAFVTWSRQLGISRVYDGLGMLVEQAAESFYLWRGVRPETEAVIKMLREKTVDGRQ